ncbi:hypothetical protein C8R43DRAFT_1034259 [Mycena crocata]|nr:hypothetical protein C8R43DRAFT_1034259 [Mycena crocata]
MDWNEYIIPLPSCGNVFKIFAAPGRLGGLAEFLYRLQVRAKCKNCTEVDLFLVIYFYDFMLTFPVEVKFYAHVSRTGGIRNSRMLWMFLPLRYFPLLYQLAIILAMANNNWTSKRYYVSVIRILFSFSSTDSCSNLDKISLGLDTAFQICYILGISWRVKAMLNKWIAVPMAMVGLLAPVINVAVSNPSVFSQCRLISSSATPRIVLFVPCLRTIFDAVAAFLLLWKFWRERDMTILPLSSDLFSFLITEEIKDIILILAIMAMEAVFLQIPSARVHARNFIIPFVDSLTAILATRFLQELQQRAGMEKKPNSIPSSRTLVFGDPDPVEIENIRLDREWGRVCEYELHEPPRYTEGRDIETHRRMMEAEAALKLPESSNVQS